MLKKLVKYGNSNALIFDKAILELLEIEEGSLVKIKTDGKSIIITPQQKPEKETVSETLTHEEFLKGAFMDQMLRTHNKEMDQLDRESLKAALRDVNADYYKTHNNKEFIQELSELNKLHADKASPIYFEAVSKLQHKYNPKIAIFEEKAKAIFQKYQNESWAKQPCTTEEMKNIQEEFFKVNNKHAETLKKMHKLMSEPEYIHQMQLITEEYKECENPTEVLARINEILYKYIPEMKEVHADMKAVGEKFERS